MKNSTRAAIAIMAIAPAIAVGVWQASASGSTTPTSSGSSFYPMSPTRVLDTRTTAAVVGQSTRVLDLSAALPANATAVSVNVTVTGATGSGYIEAYPDGGSKPVASTLNYAVGQTVANSSIVQVTDGKIDLFNYEGTSTSVQIIVDETGYFAAQGTSSCPTAVVSSASASPSVTASGPNTGKTEVFSEDFNGPVSASVWNDTGSSAYANWNNNPGDDKLDWITPSAVSVSNGVATFTATPSTNTLSTGQKAWNTGLLTTESTTQGFQVQTGDYAETKVQLPSGTGAWPALWTWKNGGNEIDSFEYHPDNPNLLEFTNHVRSGGDYYTDASTVAPGKWVTIGTYYGANSVDWYVDGVKVYSDGTGVGSTWSAYLILNLSVVAGQYHPAPSGSSPIVFSADYVHIWR